MDVVTSLLKPRGRSLVFDGPTKGGDGTVGILAGAGQFFVVRLAGLFAVLGKDGSSRRKVFNDLDSEQLARKGFEHRRMRTIPQQFPQWHRSVAKHPRQAVRMTVLVWAQCDCDRRIHTSFGRSHVRADRLKTTVHGLRHVVAGLGVGQSAFGHLRYLWVDGIPARKLSPAGGETVSTPPPGGQNAGKSIWQNAGVPPPSIALAQHLDADKLLAKDPLALLIGMVLDQQIPLERAFKSPYDLTLRLGHKLDVHELAAADPTELAAIFSQPPALHRFPASMAKRVQDMCQHVIDNHHAKPADVWKNAKSGAELLDNIAALPGFGETKAKIFQALLAKQFGVRPQGWDEACKPFGTEGSRMSVADITDQNSLQEVRAYKKQMKARSKP